MNFPSIDIQGSILSTDLLAKIRSEQATFQQGKDFNPDLTNAKLKDEISLAWQEAKGQWTIYKSKLARLKEGETGTTETRNFWISPLLTNLGYNLTFNRQSEELNGKSFPIGYRDSSLDNFPLYVGGYHESLDKRPENKQLRVSPHAMVQEYLNYSEHLYGMVTNGRQLRLLRDASRITRLSYVEFNLEKMMEEDLYSDFVILYRVLHASRMPKKIDSGAESIIEKYHQEGLEAGSTIRNKLGEAVKEAIKNLANGFINHPNNTALREAVTSGNFNADEYYRHQLRIIYRLLFLFVIEERNLVYADNKTPEAKRFNQIYFNYYSLLRLRKLAKKLLPPEAGRHYDLWQGLISTFSLFEKKEIGEKLGIMALQGDLFGYHAISGNGYDLHQCYLSNAVLLNIIKSLSYFENDNGVLIAVNYGGLDVEEFGSVYEGLLELKLKIDPIPGSREYSVDYDKSSERGKSGSHYTPEELVQPLIKHSLEYLIEDRIKPYQQKKATKETTVQSLLNLKIADVACGSGHILLSAARRLSLEIARVQTEEEQPNPVAIRKAMKDVVRNCIYGVDKNPLAVELCKIALWLEAYNPGEPLNFLDHHIKCGDAIVGLAHRSELENGIADEAYKTLPGDDKDIAKTWRDKNIKERKERAAKALQLKAEFEKSTENSVQEAMAEYKTFSQLPETTPEEIERKAKAYQKFIDGKGFTFLKAMADTQVAQFFIPKTEANKDNLMTDADYRLILSGYKGWQLPKTAKAKAVAHEQRFFHWFIEFPEVFSEGGFDCILGNPPYLGGRKISTNYGDTYLSYIKEYFPPNFALTDFVVFFLKRILKISKRKGFIAIITTDTIAQGDSRKACLDQLDEEGNELVFANPSVVWPGSANTTVTSLSIYRSKFFGKYFLNGKLVSQINSYLTDQKGLVKPFKLYVNNGKSGLGYYILGDGFILNREEQDQLIADNPSNADVIFPYLNGDDINNDVTQGSDRSVIYFSNWELERAKKYKEPFQRVFEQVYPERQKKKDKGYKDKWWQYARRAVEIANNISELKRFFVAPQTTKYISLVEGKAGTLFSHMTIGFAFEKFNSFGILQSTVFDLWVRTFSSTIGATIRLTPTDSFETFPFPKNIHGEEDDQLEFIGKNYHEHRRQLMLGMLLGLTKTYNQFHNHELRITNPEWERLLAQLDSGVRCENIDLKQYKLNKESINLIKHFQKGGPTISLREAIQGILKLRELHVQMDEAVLTAYGWGSITNDELKITNDEAVIRNSELTIDSPVIRNSQLKIDLRHDFYEVDYLPENDRVRFTIHPDARKEVLKRLLELNHKIHEEE
ncbi:MAG: N-6 DNA methylase, partial [Bacteroidia bacterium]|nr:N-6 DNA methylase [Bacteroidia bacterium]